MRPRFQNFRSSRFGCPSPGETSNVLRERKTPISRRISGIVWFKLRILNGVILRGGAGRDRTTNPFGFSATSSRKKLFRAPGVLISSDVASALRTSLNQAQELVGNLAEQTANNLQMQQVVEAQLTDLNVEHCQLGADIIRVSTKRFRTSPTSRCAK